MFSNAHALFFNVAGKYNHKSNSKMIFLTDKFDTKVRNFAIFFYSKFVVESVNRSPESSRLI